MTTALEKTMNTSGRQAFFSKRLQSLTFFHKYNETMEVSCETVRQARDKIASEGVSQILIKQQGASNMTKEIYKVVTRRVDKPYNEFVNEWFIPPIKGQKTLNAYIDEIKWVSRNGKQDDAAELSALRACQQLNQRLLATA